MAGYEDYTDHGARARQSRAGMRSILQLAGYAEAGPHSSANRELAKLTHSRGENYDYRS